MLTKTIFRFSFIYLCCDSVFARMNMFQSLIDIG